MSRRDALIAVLQALLLALFPWLRTERGVEIAGRIVEQGVLQSDILVRGVGVHIFVEPEVFYLEP